MDNEWFNKRKHDFANGQAQSTVEGTDEYVRHFKAKVFPALRAIEGHQGANLLRHSSGNGIELVVLTPWESMDAVRKFAGRIRIEPLSSRTPQQF